MYVGTAYHGWQVQKNAVTVAETLEHSLASVVGHPVKCTGAGRTDAGVHAETYIANFRTSSRIPCDRIPLAVNTRLPDDIVVIKPAPEGQSPGAPLVPLFISAFRRADELAIAMECRCYHGGEGRTRLRQLKLKGIDIAALVFAVLLCVGIGVLRHFGL